MTCAKRAPDWLCEVASPSTEKLHRTKKLRVYARERVAHVWLLDPLRRTLDVLALATDRSAPVVRNEGGGAVRAPPLDALETELDALWV